MKGFLSVVKKEVDSLKSQLMEATENNQKYRNQLAIAVEALKRIKAKDCSCWHGCGPCIDTAQSSAEEALEEIKSHE